MTASGRTDLLGKIADRWDRIPVKGPMAVAVTALGAILVTSAGGFKHGSCDSDPLRRVYNPKRLVIVDKCAEVTGTVIAWDHEHDGDYHVNMDMDDDGWTNQANTRGQHGYTVVEFVPGDPRPKKFFRGQRLRLQVTKVYDQQHKRRTEKYGWIEGHPVFKFEDVTPEGTVPTPRLPNKPALAPATEEE